MRLRQKGIAHLLLILVILSSIVIGTILVQERTNILPHAQDNSCETDEQCGDLPQFCENGETRQCIGGYCNEGTCERSCEVVDGNPLSCEETAGVEQDQGTNIDGSLPGSDKNATCQNLNPDWVYCQSEEATEGYTSDDKGYMQGGVCFRRIYKYEDKSAFTDENDNCCSTPLTPAANQEECKTAAARTAQSGSTFFPKQDGEGSNLACNPEEADKAGLDAEVGERLAIFLSIINGEPNLCVNPDLGIGQHIIAHAQGDPDNERRLILCSGENNSLDNPDYTFRVLDDNGQKVLTEEDYSDEPSSWPNISHVDEAKQMFEISI